MADLWRRGGELGLLLGGEGDGVEIVGRESQVASRISRVRRARVRVWDRAVEGAVWLGVIRMARRICRWRRRREVSRDLRVWRACWARVKSSSGGMRESILFLELASEGVEVNEWC